jgi:two-component system response regulator HydG
MEARLHKQEAEFRIVRTTHWRRPVDRSILLKPDGPSPIWPGSYGLSASRAGAAHAHHHSELLVADSDPAVHRLVAEIAHDSGLTPISASDSASLLRELDARVLDLIVLDSKLPGGDLLELTRRIRAVTPETQVIIVTAHGSFPVAVQAIKAGAFDYLTKPLDTVVVRHTIERAMEQHRLEIGVHRSLREQIRSNNGFGNIIGIAPEMQKLYRIITKVASSSNPVLILGESGTGKELVARAIHFNGSRRDRPFIPVDCGALVPTLIESELFGFEKGAFTGAERSKDGLLTIAEGGTLFLDEVGELPIDLQAKLLRALQEKEIRPVGSTRRIPLNVRIVAATNRDLELAVQQKAFRKDLYFRLAVVNLKIPPLRERKHDIPVLVHALLQRIAKSTGISREVGKDAMRILMAYDWPGNVRELENCLERASTLSSGPTLHEEDLPTQVRNGVSFLSGHGQPKANSAHEAKVMPIVEIERRAIMNAITQADGDKLLAARLLGIGKTTLYRKLREYDRIDMSDSRTIHERNESHAMLGAPDVFHKRQSK